MNHIKVNNISYEAVSSAFFQLCHWIWRDNLTIDIAANGMNEIKQRKEFRSFQADKSVHYKRPRYSPTLFVAKCWWPAQKKNHSEKNV